jgi:hypothetical protein
MSHLEAFQMESPMIRISVPWIVESVKAIDELDKLSTESSKVESFSVLFMTQNRLSHLYTQSFYKEHFKSSHGPATELYAIIDEIASKLLEKDSATVDPYSITRLHTKKKEFITIFIAELSVLPIYIATPKEGYDVDKLIFNGSCIFPPAIAQKAPDAEIDLKEAGKALAFALPTSCGFHVFRATECVVRRYWDVVAKGSDRPSLQTLGNFAAEMEKRKIGEPKVIEALKQMTRLHRNPLIHPEAILSSDEAIGIIGIARSVVGAMLSELPDVPGTTGAPPPLTS